MQRLWHNWLHRTLQVSPRYIRSRPFCHGLLWLSMHFTLKHNNNLYTFVANVYRNIPYNFLISLEMAISAISPTSWNKDLVSWFVFFNVPFSCLPGPSLKVLMSNARTKAWAVQMEWDARPCDPDCKARPVHQAANYHLSKNWTVSWHQLLESSKGKGRDPMQLIGDLDAETHNRACCPDTRAFYAGVGPVLLRANCFCEDPLSA